MIAIFNGMPSYYVSAICTLLIGNVTAIATHRWTV